MIYMVQRLQEADAEYAEVTSKSERIMRGCVWLSHLPKIVLNSHIISGTSISVVDATSSSDAALANVAPFQSFQAENYIVARGKWYFCWSMFYVQPPRIPVRLSIWSTIRFSCFVSGEFDFKRPKGLVSTMPR